VQYYFCALATVQSHINNLDIPHQQYLPISHPEELDQTLNESAERRQKAFSALLAQHDSGLLNYS